MSTAVSSATVLKEWAVCEAALAAGQTIVLLRKGGIREPTRQFRIEQESFGLFPGYEHQRLELVKPSFQSLVARSRAAAPAPGTVRISLWLEISDAFELMQPEPLQAIHDYHMWTPDFAEERLRWRPSKPLHVLLARAYRLATPLELPYEARYGGCTSWVELAQAPEQVGRQAVLDDAAYAAMAAPIRAALAELPTAHRGPGR